MCCFVWYALFTVDFSPDLVGYVAEVAAVKLWQLKRDEDGGQ